MPNISGSKKNHNMELGQLTDIAREIYFLKKNYAGNEAGRLVPDLFLFFEYA